MPITDDPNVHKEKLNQLSHKVIGLCMEVHRELGPGLLESAYEYALAYELTKSGIKFERQRDTPLNYKGVKLDCGYRLDFIIEDCLILELKTVNELLPVHNAQLMTYLRLENRNLGLLINFNVPVLKSGVRRIVRGEMFKDEKLSSVTVIGLFLLGAISLFTKLHDRLFA